MLFQSEQKSYKLWLSSIRKTNVNGKKASDMSNKSVVRKKLD